MKHRPRCVLLFSGGRDSSVAALRLARHVDKLDLVTVTTEHLVGIERLHTRLDELSATLNCDLRWIRVRQPALPLRLSPDMRLASHSCLPCQQSYLSASMAWARQSGAKAIATGYAAYQSDWPEQTPEAVELMDRVLRQFGVEFLLPARSVNSKDEAKQILTAAGLYPESLEQKCLKQITNRALDPTELARELQVLEAQLEAAFSSAEETTLEVMEVRQLRGGNE